MQVKSAGRVLDLIDLLGASREPVPLRTIVAMLSLPKSSAHALCQTLVARGYATQDEKGRYSLLESYRHGLPYKPEEERLVALAYPVMQRLRDACGETVILSTMTSRGDIRRLTKCVSRQSVRYDVELDAPVASYCTATGRAILAFRSPAQIEAYLARTSLLSYTAFTRTDAGQIEALLAQVRKEGVAINDEEFITGSTGVAAPIRDRQGTVVAALNLGTLSSRFRTRRDEFVDAVRESAAIISGLLAARYDGHEST